MMSVKTVFGTDYQNDEFFSTDLLMKMCKVGLN